MRPHRRAFGAGMRPSHRSSVSLEVGGIFLLWWDLIRVGSPLN